MSIQRLPVFLSAAKYLNFTKAAEEHCISQTAVSLQIKQLEQELGFPLFIRANRGVTLTPAGEVFYRQCGQLMREYQSAVAEGQRMAQGSPNTLRLGYASEYELLAAFDLLRQYRQRYPDRMIELEDGTNQTIVDMMGEGKLDVAVISWVGNEVPDWMSYRILREEPCALMISSRHPLAAQPEIDRKDLVGIPLVMNNQPNHRSSVDNINSMYQHLGLGNNKRLYADGFYSMAMIVLLEMAVSVMPEGLRNLGMDGLSFVPIKNFNIPARTSIIYPKKLTVPAVQDLLSLL